MGPKLRAIAPKRKKVESSSDSSDDEILDAKDLQFVLEKVWNLFDSVYILR